VNCLIGNVTGIGPVTVRYQAPENIERDGEKALSTTPKERKHIEVPSSKRFEDRGREVSALEGAMLEMKKLQLLGFEPATNR